MVWVRLRVAIRVMVRFSLSNFQVLLVTNSMSSSLIAFALVIV